MRNMLLGSAVVFLALGCAPSPKEVARDAAGEVKSLVREALGAAESTNGLESVTMMTRGYSAASTGSASSSTVPKVTASAYDSQLDQLGKFLTDRVFDEKNVESSAGGALIFRLKGEQICTDGTYPADPTCVDQVNRMELRVKAVMPSAGAYDLTVLVGPARLAPLTFRIRKAKSLAWESDLAQVKGAAEFINSVVNGQALGLPRLMEGIVEVKLEKNGTNDYSLSYSVLAAVRVEVDDAAGLTSKFRTAAAKPLSFVRLDGNRRQMQIAVELGETEVTAPYKSFVASNPGTTGSTVPLTAHLAGASYSLDLTAGKTDFVVAHLGIGDAQSWLDYGGSRVFTADLNPLSGRHFDLGFKQDTDGLPLVSVLPNLDLTAAFNLLPLKGAGTNVDPAFEHETYSLKFGEAQAPTLKPFERMGHTSGGIKVVAGKLSLSTDRPGVAPIIAAAGQCVTFRPLPMNAHPLLGTVLVEPCP